MRITTYDTLQAGHRHILKMPEPSGADDPQLSEYLPTWCEVSSFAADRRPTFINEGHPTGFFATTASDDSYCEWFAHIATDPDCSSYPATGRETDFWNPREHSPTLEFLFSSRKANILVEDYEGTKTILAPDKRICNHFTDAYEDSSSGSETYAGPVYFTSDRPAILDRSGIDWWTVFSSNDLWSTTNSNCAIFAIGRNVWDASLSCWRPAVGVSAESVGSLGAMKRDPLITNYRDVLQAATDALYDYINGSYIPAMHAEFDAYCCTTATPIAAGSCSIPALTGTLVGVQKWWKQGETMTNDVPECS